MNLTTRSKMGGVEIVATNLAPYVTAVHERNRLDDAIVALAAAATDAAELGFDAWQFAVEFDSLAARGLTTADLRWLALKGLVQHAIERTSHGEYQRVFDHEVGPTTIGRGTCVTLTPLGMRVAEQVCSRIGRRARCAASSSQRPVWNAETSELRFGGLLVKRFRVPAPNQQRILSAFEEEGWPVRIDAPLPRRYNRVPKRVLHDTIQSLNSSQKNSILRFYGDGSGQGIRWQVIDSQDL